MGRKIRSKALRDRDAYQASKELGRPTIYNTSNGNILLNLMKHYCLQKPYENEEYQNLMFKEMKKRAELYKQQGATQNA